MKSGMNDIDGLPQVGCNVNSKFNFAVGGLAIAAALLIGYLAYVFWWK